MVKLERLQTTPYSVSYQQPNGNLINYNWVGAKDYARCIVEVDEVVYDWLKFNTVCFQKKKLVVVDEEQKQDMEYILSEEEVGKTYTLQQIKELLGGSLKDLKAEVEQMSDDDVREFINIAKQINLDSASKRNVLAKKLKMPVEIIFGEEE